MSKITRNRISYTDFYGVCEEIKKMADDKGVINKPMAELARFFGVADTTIVQVLDATGLKTKNNVVKMKPTLENMDERLRDMEQRVHDLEERVGSMLI